MKYISNSGQCPVQYLTQVIIVLFQPPLLICTYTNLLNLNS